MVLAMTRPTKHPKTGIYYFRKVVPEEYRDVVGKREIKLSLKTKDPAEARQKHIIVSLQVEEDLERRLSEANRSLPLVDELDKETIKRAGEAYYRMLLEEDDEIRLDGFSENVETEGTVQEDVPLTRSLSVPAHEKIKLTSFDTIAPTFEQYGQSRQENEHGLRYDYARGLTDIFWEGEVDEVLSWENLGLRLAPRSPSRKLVLRELQAATLRAHRALSQRDQGEPIETPPAPNPTPRKAHSSSTLTDVLEGWWREAQATGLSLKTYESYSATVKRLAVFLKHEDTRRITPEDIIRYKDHRLSEISSRTRKAVSAKTVKDSDLAGLKAIFNWAVTNRKMTSNPAEGITIKLGKKVKTRSPAFTDTEAHLILNHALNHKHTGRSLKTYYAKRWVPWLCAYTGARVGEMVQLRKQDIKQENGYWIITITPEAGTVKDKEARTVPLHSHLLELGFVEFVQKADAGYLFFDLDKNSSQEKRAKTQANRLRDFVREVVTDPNVQPNHGWRHRFKTVCREAGIDRRIVDEIQGHAPGTVSDSYGEVTIKAMVKALAKLPCYPIKLSLK